MSVNVESQEMANDLVFAAATADLRMFNLGYPVADIVEGSRRMSHPARFAVACAGSVKEIAAYLPDNYEVINFHDANPDGSKVNCVIMGYDYLGWTLEDYVIPRLASGSIACREHANRNDAETSACAAMN